VTVLIGAGFKPALVRQTQLASVKHHTPRSLVEGGLETRPYKHHHFCVTSPAWLGQEGGYLIRRHDLVVLNDLGPARDLIVDEFAEFLGRGEAINHTLLG
jgi:hypothetical protein